MTVDVVSEAEILQEASALLLQRMSPTKVARFWASWQIGQGDYLLWRDEAFADETVDSLYAKVETFQNDPASVK